MKHPGSAKEVFRERTLSNLRKTGKRVGTVTLENLVSSDRLPDLEERDWFFCELTDCDVVYFSSEQDTVMKDALTVRVGAKEQSAATGVLLFRSHRPEHSCGDRRN